MKTKIIFIERKFWEFVSIEKVFRQIAQSLSREGFTYDFKKLNYGNNLLGILKNLLTFKKTSADIFHITGHIHYIALILPKEKTVLTIHDLGFLYQNKGIKRILLKKLFLDLPIKKLNYITAISEFTKSEIIKFSNCNNNKIHVIENPLTIHKTNFSGKSFNKNCPRILQIGTTENKNLPNLLKAIKGINCILEIIGKLNNEQIDLLDEYCIKYQNSYGLNDKEIIQKYEKADLVTFCSTYEGFGMPIIEAQAMHTPVITSNISPMKEVAGKGALLVNPHNVEEIRNAIQKIFGDDKYRAKLTIDGLNNIKRFDSNTIAKQYEKLYQLMLVGK